MDYEIIVSTLAAIIALCALFATIWQGFITRKHNKLSVRPFLNFDLKTENGNFVLFLNNNGFGPALITDFIINFNDKSLGKNSDEIAINLGEELEIGQFEKKMYFPGKNQAIASGESYRILEIFRIFEDNIEKERFMNDILWLEVEINYESIYEEKFSLSGPNLV